MAYIKKFVMRESEFNHIFLLASLSILCYGFWLAKVYDKRDIYIQKLSEEKNKLKFCGLNVYKYFNFVQSKTKKKFLAWADTNNFQRRCRFRSKASRTLILAQSSSRRRRYESTLAQTSRHKRINKRRKHRRRTITTDISARPLQDCVYTCCQRHPLRTLKYN